MNKIIFCKVKKIIFTDGTTLEDIDACMNGDFVVVAHDESAPDFYPVSSIKKLESVEEIMGNTGAKIYY